MAERVIQLSEPRCTLWRVTDDEGRTHYETKVGDHKLLRFETEAEALAYYKQWVLEVRKEREQFGD
jgi:hypothetical protein